MRNLTMMTDFYQLTMMYGYMREGMDDKRAVFDLFYRRTNENSAYAVAAGLEQLVEYINNLHFEEEDLDYLRGLNCFDEDFFDYLRNMRFEGDIYAVPEGTLVFPFEPIIRVEAPIMQAQLIETALLNIINHQTLIATKASRVVQAAQGDLVMEFGLRRAQGPDAGIYGARAAIIGGCKGTSNVLTGEMFGVSVKGTHAHSWVMSFPSELEAFRAYARTYPSACLLLVDTYDTLKSGVPNAITVFKELRAKGYEPMGIRLDSGDLAYLSIQARKMMDEAGFPNATITASNDLDEHIIWELKAQGAKIDAWGVGTRLITSNDNPALGGVYKMAAEIDDGVLIPKMKISENPGKMTNPGKKKLYRIYGTDNMALADLICLHDEVIDLNKSLTIFDPVNTWKSMTLQSGQYWVKELLIPIFLDGRQVYSPPALDEIYEYAAKELSTFWTQYKRLTKPHIYKVDLSTKLYRLRESMLRESVHTVIPEMQS
jgi:nicotinate phosphoribosyltransferase